MSEVAEETTPATNTDTSDLANGGIKEKKETDEGASDRRHNTSMNNNRSPFRGRGSFRGSRGSFRGGYRGRRGGGMGMSTKHLDEKAMYLIFEKPISKFTANEIMAFGKDATTVGFGRGCTIHFKSPEEAKEIMEKIKELKFAGLEPNVEYAYKKRVFDTEKRTPVGDEEEEEERSSPTKKQKVENDEAVEEDKGNDDKGDGDVTEGEREDGGEEEVEDEGDGEEVEGEVEGEEAEEGGDYAEEGHEEDYEGGDQEFEEGGDQEYEEDEEGGEQADENEDDVDDDDEYN